MKRRTPQPNIQTSPFLRLAGEIRNKIYYHVLKSPSLPPSKAGSIVLQSPFRDKQHDPKSQSPHTSADIAALQGNGRQILRVNRQIYKEASAVLLQCSTMHLNLWSNQVTIAGDKNVYDMEHIFSTENQARDLPHSVPRIRLLRYLHGCHHLDLQIKHRGYNPNTETPIEQIISHVSSLVWELAKNSHLRTLRVTILRVGYFSPCGRNNHPYFQAETEHYLQSRCLANFWLFVGVGKCGVWVRGLCDHFSRRLFEWSSR